MLSSFYNTPALRTYLLLASLTAPITAETITLSVFNSDWNGAVWGDPAAAPTTGNDYVVDGGGTIGGVILRMPAGSGDSTFGGDSLTLSNGGRGLLKTIEATATVNGPVILDFGWLQLGQNTASTGTLVATELRVTGTGNLINSGFSGRTFIIDAPLNGDGDFTVDYAQGDNGSGREIIFNEVGNFSGDITVDQGMQVRFGVDYVFPGAMTLVNAGILSVESGQTLTFAPGNLTDEVNGEVAPGTYTGATLDALGFNYLNNGGTIVVGGAALAAPVLTISLNPENANNFDFTWFGREGTLYNLVSSSDLSTLPATWDVWDGRSGLLASEAANILENIPGDGTRRFFAIVEQETL